MATAKKVTGSDRRAEAFRARGFVPASEVAERVGVAVQTVYRWVDNEEVEGLTVMHRRYVKLSSVISKLGPEASVALGLTTGKKQE